MAKGGTKLRHLNHSNINELENMIEALPNKVEIKSVNYVGSNWYCHFTILDYDFVKPIAHGDTDEIKELNKKTKKRGK